MILAASASSKVSCMAGCAAPPCLHTTQVLQTKRQPKNRTYNCNKFSSIPSSLGIVPSSEFSFKYLQLAHAIVAQNLSTEPPNAPFSPQRVEEAQHTAPLSAHYPRPPTEKAARESNLQILQTSKQSKLARYTSFKLVVV